MNEENELETTTKCEREKERKYKKGIIRSEVKKKEEEEECNCATFREEK